MLKPSAAVRHVTTVNEKLNDLKFDINLCLNFKNNFDVAITVILVSFLINKSRYFIDLEQTSINCNALF